MKKYILKDHTPVECNDLIEWAMWFETGDRKVDFTEIGTTRVSTVFLGLDHSFDNSKPLLFETMIFGGKHDGYQERCSTWDEAVKQHADAVDLCHND